MASQLCEDCFNYHKNSRLVKSKKKYRRVEKAMGVVLAKQVLSRQHRYEEVPCDIPTSSKAIRLPKSAFAAEPKLATMNLGSVSGVQSSAPFFSPSAANWTLRDADLVLVRYCYQNNCWSKASTAWLGELCKASHSLLLRHPQETGNKWVFGMHHWRDSCAMGFIAEEVTLPGSGITAWQPALGQDPLFFCMVETQGWTAVHYKWRSPAWQCARSGAATLPVAIRAVAAEENEGEESLLCVAAKQAFFSLPKTWLIQLAKLRGVNLSGGTSLFDMLYSVMGGLLDMQDEQLMHFLGRRMSTYAQQERFAEEFAELDEAAELLERQDQQKVKQEKQSHETLKEQASTYTQAYVAKQRDLRQQKKNGGSRSKAKVKTIRIPRFPDHDIELETARALAPPGSSLWMSRAEGNWQGHFKPFPRISRSWNRWGESEALRLVLQALWDRYCQRHGLTRSETGVVGLWPDEATASGGASSSSRAQ